MEEMLKQQTELIVPAKNTFYLDYGKGKNAAWHEKEDRAEWDRIADMFVAIYNNDFDNFKKLCKEPPYYLVDFYEKLDDQGNPKNEGKPYFTNTKEQEIEKFIKTVLNKSIAANKNIDFHITLDKLGLPKKHPMYGEYGFTFSPIYYILIKFENLF